ncbi:winged helix-turn-helix transcriptional regulator [Sporosarcina sp. Marseille-Q4063]|uniref:carbohydrate kinase n=1 Tax=Sporosarcina sp. Marseille-Q4063 TaxID=2810514 RepID=UPI001BAFCA7F|nr:carbohydrate kinase [Sporosarcina sp. Marseille-Q4063]QUW21459.1 winged helix-turn-helix transcriptional regulator [Sporosarcina sp. Marseille-Q4063]
MNKEKQILHHIKINPFISQQELSAKVGLSRSAVANYIANLTKRGEIKGRAYILQEESSIVCIGGANTDRKARSDQEVRLYSSNPVKTTEVCGGVARNFAENLSRLGYNTSLMTSIGDDKEGDWLLQETKNHGVDVSQVWILQTERTGTYTTLLDENGETVVAMADMNIYEKITIPMIEEKWSYIVASQAVFMDTNISVECIDYVINRCRDENISLYIDPISSAKVNKLPHRLEGVEVLMLSQEEAEVLGEAKIDSIEDCENTANKIRERGVQKVIILLSDQGVYYSSPTESGHLSPFKTEIVDVTGASDAFSSCTIYGLLHEESLLTACQLGLAGSALTLQTEESVSIHLRPEKIYEIVKEYAQN